MPEGLLNKRLATEHQGIVEHAHAEHCDARFLDQHGTGAQQQTDQQRPHRHRGGQRVHRVHRDRHTHTPER